MIETREQLIHVLTEAAQIEHNLLCSYLYAAFSMKRAGEAGLTKLQGAAVERWRKVILGVALEEMAHLATVNNLLLAVGGAPHLDRPNLPLAPGYHPAGIVVRLTPFSRATLDHFIFLERAGHHRLADAPGFEPVEAPRTPSGGRLTPSAEDYDTIGELYDSIAEGLERIAHRIGEAQLIDPTGSGQLDAEIAALPNVGRLTSLASALEAIHWIKEEGEGSSGQTADLESHFDRFCALREEWLSLSAADPDFEPAWPAAEDPVMRKPAAGLARVWVTAEPAAGLLDLGNALYGFMLQVLSQTFACEDRADQARLMKACVELMEACGAAGSALARLPASPDHPGVTAGLTFASPRNLGFRPVGVKRRQLFLERVRELQAGAEAMVARLEGDVVEKLPRRLANAAELLAGEG
ncbi:ferritin-like domain-containing protein [Phenylobacterium sp.]|jgi:hypothetical protein|uniref:ferritin-like domain-containing protein n=1 Tax=Phenylobacterium sp. TaxID=1871053 RepID=UPI002E377D50|nr:ferritin-like domain-containing protein [Phenylobacterium sp.]HEX2560565.1 ferritin-like domain-containing protein [Phenylobacterium sp.]